MSIGEVPFDIWSDILSRLPAKSVVHCKSVCKQWRSLLDDSSFLRLFLDRANTDGDNTHVIISGRNSDYSPMFFFLNSKLSEPVVNDLTSSIPLRRMFMKLIGSCNGLLCLIRYTTNELDEITIWNPTTKEYVEIPHKLPRYNTDRCYIPVMGFGCDSSMQKYKVLRLVIFFEADTYKADSYQADIYTLGTNSWRRITGGPSSPFLSLKTCPPRMLYLKGFLHYAFSNSLSIILAFDIKNENFFDIPVPKPAASTYWHDFGVLQGCLCIYSFKIYQLDIWMMKDYGVPASWTRQLSLVRQLSPERGLDWFSEPLVLHKTGEILIETNNCLVYEKGTLLLYNTMSKRVQSYTFCCNPTENLENEPFNFRSLMVYIESPISIASLMGSDKVDEKARETPSKRNGLARTRTCFPSCFVQVMRCVLRLFSGI